MTRGDHISVRRFLYSHHGIDVGDGTVIHMTGTPSQKVDACVTRTSWEEFTRGGVVRVHEYGKRFDPDVIVARAFDTLGNAGYDLVANNCEHFACWCATGETVSSQVVVVRTAGTVVGVSSVGAAGTVGAMATAGSIAGLSGSGIMSGLASIGSLVGGGVVAGLVITAAGPAAGSATVMNYALRDNPHRTHGDRAALAAGRAAANVTAAAGVIGSVAAVSSAGVVGGLSAAGITSGLAAIGAILGGGMVAGTALSVGLPALLAALIGYAVYRLVRVTADRDAVLFAVI